MISTLLQQHNEVKEKLLKVSTYVDFMKKRSSALEKEEESYKYKSDVYQKCSEIFKSWLDDSLKKSVDSMAELSTAALQHIINDQDLTFSIKQEQKNNRVAVKFVLSQTNPDGTVDGDPLQSYGGGASAIISLVLRLAVMTKMNMGNLLLLDESMAFLADTYVPNAGSFMRQLSERTGINILMVTHNKEYLNYAHTAYEGENKGSFKLRKLRTDGL
jgi:DNA repair exonuclease SbcCD ATPase subunit